MVIDPLDKLLSRYVRNNSNIMNLAWDPTLSEKLLFDPFSRSEKNRKKTSHYFLLVAAINETELIGRAENSRALMILLHKTLKDKLFSEKNFREIQNIIQEYSNYNELGVSKLLIPDILSSINLFVNNITKGDLPKYASQFSKPIQMVEDIAKYVDRMDGRYKQKTWMYLQWMTRHYPGLGIFNNFHTRDLYISMTSYIRDVGCCLGFCPEHDDPYWKICDNIDRCQKSLTKYSRELFPEDPTIVDYPFYLLGRWIRGKSLNRKLLLDYLTFLEELYNKIGTHPVKYDLVSRQRSTFEENIKTELEKTKVLFYYESNIFNLPGDFTYKPDFLLPRNKIKGKTIVLEPHGIWEYPKPRQIQLAKQKITIPTYGIEKDPDEQRFVRKMRLFKEIYGKNYYIILIVPARVKQRVNSWYPDIYDELYEATDIPKLLKQIKKS